MAQNLVFLSIKKKYCFLNLADIFKLLRYVWVMTQFHLVMWPEENSTHFLTTQSTGPYMLLSNWPDKIREDITEKVEK